MLKQRGESMNTTLKRGDIVKRYHINNGIYLYGVVADTFIFMGRKCVVSFMYREKMTNFHKWTDDEESFIRVEQESLPSELYFLSDISKIFAHVRIDYSVTENGKTVSRYNDTLLTPLRSNCILEALRGSLMRDDDGYISSFSSKCFFNLFNEFFDKEYGHCVPFPEIKFYLVP